MDGDLSLLILLGAAVYFVPSFVAGKRGHRNTNAITALNLLLGWTFLGWVVALVWALMAQEGEGRGTARE